MRAVVFDFDGVIANSEPLHFRAFRDVLAAEGISPDRSRLLRAIPGLQRRARVPRDRRGAMDGAGTIGTVADLIARKAVVIEEARAARVDSVPGRPRSDRSSSHAIARSPSPRARCRAEIERTLAREQLAAHFTVIVVGRRRRGQQAGARSIPPRRRTPRCRSPGSANPLTPSDCVAVEDSPWGLESATARASHDRGHPHLSPRRTARGRRRHRHDRRCSPGKCCAV